MTHGWSPGKSPWLRTPKDKKVKTTKTFNCPWMFPNQPSKDETGAQSSADESSASEPSLPDVIIWLRTGLTLPSLRRSFAANFPAYQTELQETKETGEILGGTQAPVPISAPKSHSSPPGQIHWSGAAGEIPASARTRSAACMGPVTWAHLCCAGVSKRRIL